jgi:hypothetical protein
MREHPDFFNVRKMAIALAGAPMLFLLSIALSDFSIHQFKVWQATGVWCTSQDSGGHPLRHYGNECR